MTTFFSYSDDPGHKAGRIIVSFLEEFVPESQPWISDRIEYGQQWLTNLMQTLRGANTIVVCYTKESIHNPFWMLFEAGAVWKADPDNDQRVIPILIDAAIDLREPLSLFQSIPQPKHPDSILAADGTGLIALAETLRRRFSIPEIPVGRRREFTARAKQAADEIAGEVRAARKSRLNYFEPHIRLRPNETDGEDYEMMCADTVQLVGLTFKNFSEALSRNDFSMNATDVSLAIYSLPVLMQCHPKLSAPVRMSPRQVKKEWIECFTTTVQKLADLSTCRNLKVHLSSSEPGFAMSYIENKANGIKRIRYTPYVAGYEPMDLPTVVVSAKMNEQSAMYIPFDSVRKQWFESDRTLRFWIKKNGQLVWTCNAKVGSMREFCQQLSKVCTNRLYADLDRMHNVLVPKQTGRQGDTLRPSHFHAMNATYEGWQWQYTPTHSANPALKSTITLLPVCPTTLGVDIQNVTDCEEIVESHIVGAFVLLHYKGEIALSFKGSQTHSSAVTWKYDVPGGCVSISDEHLEAAVVREVFEEFGLLLRSSSLRPAGLKYDPSGPKTMRPVVACYFTYELSNDEREFLVLSNQDTKGNIIEWFKVCDARDAVKEKTFCHAPDHVIAKVSAYS